MTKLLMTCGLLAALTACATSQPTPGTSAAPAAQSGAAPVAAAPAKPKLICDETARIDSHFQQRVCMTPEQVEARRKATQAAMQNRAIGSASACGDSGCSGGPPR